MIAVEAGEGRAYVLPMDPPSGEVRLPLDLVPGAGEAAPPGVDCPVLRGRGRIFSAFPRRRRIGMGRKRFLPHGGYRVLRRERRDPGVGVADPSA